MKKFLFSILFIFFAVSVAFAGVIFLSFGDKMQTDISPLPQNQNQQESEKISDQELKKEIGQMIIAGFRGTEADEGAEIYKMIKDLQIGGVVLFDYDVPSKSFPRNITSPEQVKKLIFDIQKYSSTPLFIAVDQEGGNVSRLKQKYGFKKILSAKKMGQDKTLKTTGAESKKISEELKNAGFNMNLAPVVDLDINPENPAIGALGRSFSAKADEVIANAEIFINNHSKNSIITVAKHFPGQGSASADSHLGTTDVTESYNQDEIIPYEELNKKGLLDAVMVAHVFNKKIDSKYPASMSKIFLEDILRNEIGFKGVIFSDDMQMSAISANYSLEEAVVDAVRAGIDGISVLNNVFSGYDKDAAYKTRDAIFNAVKENKISRERIKESYDKIIALKKRFKIIQPAAEEVRSAPFKLLQVPETLSFGEVYDIAKYAEKLTGVRAATMMAIAEEELFLEETELCYVTDFETGEGIRGIDGKIMTKTMKPDRDIKDFLEIASELNIDPKKALVTCPMSFGWGGAMGPADFIPSTWAKYKEKVKEITGKPADPWDIKDAFLAMGLYLADSGASARARNAEWDAAMIYFSGSPKSGYNFYADQVMAIAEKIQKDIDIIEKK